MGEPIKLNTSITREVFLNIKSKIAGLNESETLILSGSGGKMKWAFHLFDVIRTARYPIRGIVTDDLYSAGVMIVQACDERFISKSARLGFHKIGCEEDTEMTENLKKIIEEYQEKMIYLLTFRSKCSREEIMYFMKTGRILSSREALEKGLVDKIIDFENFEEW